MQIEIEKPILLEAIETAGKGVNPRSPLPILSHLLLEANATTLRVTGTDLDLGLRLSVPCKTAQEGSICVPASLLKEIVSKLPAAPVALIANESRLTLRCGRSKFEVTMLPSEEYPNLPSGANAAPFDLAQKTLKEAIRLVMPAVAKSDESRAVMTGVQFILDGESLILVSTDGRRMAWVRYPVDTIDKQDVVVPGRALAEIGRACTDTEDPITLRIQEAHIWATARNLQMHSRLLEGHFPDYTRVLSITKQRGASVSREALVSGLKRMMVVAQERQSPNLIVFDFVADLLTLRANTPDLGLGEEGIPCEFEGAPLVIAFNGKYLLEALASLSCDIVYLDLQDDTTTALLHEGDANYRYLLMPVKLREAVPEEEAVHA